MSEQESGQKSSNSGQRKRRPNNRNRNRNAAKNRSQGQGEKSNTNGNREGNKRPNSNKRRSNNRNRNNNRKGPRLDPLEKAEKAYFNLLEKHLHSRRKYFDFFHRANPQQLAKLERNFHRTLQELSTYEEGLKEDVKEKFLTKKDSLKKDLTYSKNHELPESNEPVPFEGDFEDPHFLRSQQESFQDDIEESSGTIDDYKAYKGLA